MFPDGPGTVLGRRHGNRPGPDYCHEYLFVNGGPRLSETGAARAPGDSITIRATGIAMLNGALPTVTIGDVYAQVQSVQAVPAVAGVYEIAAEMPWSIEEGNAIPVMVIMPPDRSGAGQQSNRITIAVERRHL